MSRALRRVAAFEPVALLDLLDHLGYKREQVFFESQPGSFSQPTVVQGLDLKSEPIDHVVVQTNFGLLGAQSPLPSYFQSIIDDGDHDETALLAFLRFFDHGLIRSYLDAVYPERNTDIVRDWEQTKRSYVKMLGIRSVSTLHWLFELAFPELEVQVSKGPLTRRVQLDPARLGKVVLGAGAVLGGFTKVPVPGFHVRLLSEDERFDADRPWAEEVRRRLDEVVFPALEDPGVDIKVSLVIRSERVFAGLRPGSYLGFDRIEGGEARAREVHVFGGLVAVGAKRGREKGATA
jgi:hypothetical protein